MNNTRRLCLVRIAVWLFLGAVLCGAFYYETHRWTTPEEKAPSSRPKAKMQHLELVYPIMGTFARVSLFGVDKAELDQAGKTVSDVFSRVQKLGNLYDKESELSRLNATAASAPFLCSDELYGILKEAKKAYVFSDGLFDISAKPLMDLWGFYRKRGGKTPNAEEVRAAIDKVGLDKVVFDDMNKSVFFRVSGMALDLGGIAKGYAVDAAYHALNHDRLTGGILNLGGNMRFFGVPGDGRTFYRIGIQSPRERNGVCGFLGLNDCGVATSGDYERFVVLDGKKYAHIMNPKTGYPVENMLSVTAVTSSAFASDIASTSVFLGGHALAEKFAKNDAKAFFVIFRASGDDMLRECVGTPPAGGSEFSQKVQ